MPDDPDVYAPNPNIHLDPNDPDSIAYHLSKSTDLIECLQNADSIEIDGLYIGQLWGLGESDNNTVDLYAECVDDDGESYTFYIYYEDLKCNCYDPDSKEWTVCVDVDGVYQQINIKCFKHVQLP